MTAPTAEALEQRAKYVLEEYTEIPLSWMSGHVQVQQADVVKAMLAFAAEQVAAGVAAERERAAGATELRIAEAEGVMWQALRDNGPPNKLIDWLLASLGHLSDGLHDTQSTWADYAKRLYAEGNKRCAHFRSEQP